MIVPEPLLLRDQPVPAVLALVRFGTHTLSDELLARSASETFSRWGFWGFSVMEVPHGDFSLLARLVPTVSRRRFLFLADGREVLAAGFALFPTLQHPHWTMVVSEPTPDQFARARSLFRGPEENPAWAPGPAPVR
jgi:hypothetical protein